MTKATLPEQNLDAEIGVIGSCMKDCDRIDDVAMILRPEDFYAGHHQDIFREMLEMHACNRRPDVNALGSWMKKRGLLEGLACALDDDMDKATSGRLFLKELHDAVLTAHNAEFYAGLVAEAALIRRLENAGHEIVRVSQFRDLDARERLSKAEAEMFSVSETRIGKEPAAAASVLSQSLDAIISRCDSQSLAGLATGFHDLDKLTGGMKNGELVIVAGRPGMGKSAFAANVAEQISMERDAKALILSLEMSRTELGERLLCSHAKVDARKARNGFISEFERRQLQESNAKLSRSQLYIDDTPGRTMVDIASLCRRQKRRKGLDVAIVDYLQIIAAEDRRAPREQQVAAIAQRLKGMARELDRPVICLAQLNRQAETSRGNRPSLAMLRESGAVEQEADQVWFIHRDEYYASDEAEKERLAGKAVVIVAKNRNGPTGEAPLLWVGRHTRFQSLAAGREFDAREWQ